MCLCALIPDDQSPVSAKLMNANSLMNASRVLYVECTPNPKI